MARAQYDQQRAYRLSQEKAAKHERRADQKDAVSGVAGQVWRSVARRPSDEARPARAPDAPRPRRRKGYVFLAWVLVKTLLA